jgi:hypothetical protein
MLAFGYEAAHVLPHGSYVVNLGNPDLYDLPVAAFSLQS